MSKPTKSRKISKEKTRQDTPVVVYLWVIGLGLMGYLVIGKIMLGTRPHPVHWIAGLAGAILGYFVGRLWYRWRGDVV